MIAHNCQAGMLAATQYLGVPTFPQPVMPVVVQSQHRSVECPHGVTYWYERPLDAPTSADLKAVDEALEQGWNNVAAAMDRWADAVHRGHWLDYEAVK